MAGLQPGDNVEWRAGSTPSTFHTRKGTIKEVLSSGIALVKVKAQGETIVEEIRVARLRKIELPAPVKEKAVEIKRRKTKAAAKGKKSRKIARKKAASKA